MGRWLSQDPIGEKGGVNLYGFVGNDGINQIDLHGLFNTRPLLRKQFMEWYEANKDTSWTTSLPKCPDKLCMKKEEAYVPDRKEWTKFWEAGLVKSGPGHPGHSFMLVSETVNGHAQQCTYLINGELIKEIGYAAGSADFVSRKSSVSGHLKADYQPFVMAETLDNGVFGEYNRLYLDVRPVDQGGGATIRKEDCCDNYQEDKSER